VRSGALHELYSPAITAALRKALRRFDRSLPGFISDAGLLHGVETRTSSPVSGSQACRLLRCCGCRDELCATSRCEAALHGPGATIAAFQVGGRSCLQQCWDAARLVGRCFEAEQLAAAAAQVRIERSDDCQSPSLLGLYPAGEGAGYAGGIVSAAVDGLRVGEALVAEVMGLVNAEGSRAKGMAAISKY
jgi:hypothetical protein